MNPVFASAVRRELARMVTAPRVPRPRRLWLGVGIVVGFVVAGGGTAIAASVWGVPGSPAVTTLTSPVHATETGTASIALGTAPAHTNNVHIDLVCLTPGTYTFPDGASVSCAVGDVGTPSDEASYDMNAKPGQTSITIEATPGSKWTLTAEWGVLTTTKWATNAHGQTYGAQNANGTPDLVAVNATNGKLGYVVATQLADADGDTAAEHFTSPSQALAWQRAHDGKVTSIPVYEPDGTTQIGVFNVGG